MAEKEYGRPFIGPVDVHHCHGLQFSDKSAGETRWLKIGVLDSRGHVSSSVDIFYGSAMEPEDVRRAMEEYLGLGRWADG